MGVGRRVQAGVPVTRCSVCGIPLRTRLELTDAIGELVNAANDYRTQGSTVELAYVYAALARIHSELTGYCSAECGREMAA